MAQESEQDSVQQEEVVEEAAISEEVVCEIGAPGWVVTFGDMMSLLLTFFILLLSFATLDKVQFNKLSGVMKEGFGVITRTNKQRIPKRDTMIKIKRRTDTNSRKRAKGDQIKRLINQISGSDMSDRTKSAMEVFEQNNQVKVLIPADDVFVTGTEQIRPRFYPMLNLLSVQAREVMADKELSIEVRSNKDVKCDPSFLRNGSCDYWLLTGYQAISLSRYMQNEGEVSASKIIPVGRGTAPLHFANEEERAKKRGSTVEFVYVTPPQSLLK